MLLLNPEAKKGGEGLEVEEDQQIRPDCFQPQSYFLHQEEGQQRTMKLGHKRNWCRDSEMRQWTLWGSELHLIVLSIPTIWQVCQINLLINYWMHTTIVSLLTRSEWNQLCHIHVSSPGLKEPGKTAMLTYTFSRVLFCKLLSGGKTAYKTIYIIFRYLWSKGTEKSTHQNVNSATVRIVAFLVFFILCRIF